MRLRLSLSRVSNSSRLEAADAADWLLRVSLSGFLHAVARAEHGKAEAVTCRRVRCYRSTSFTRLNGHDGSCRSETITGRAAYIPRTLKTDSKPGPTRDVGRMQQSLPNWWNAEAQVRK
jgi:hypothetical protein